MKRAEIERLLRQIDVEYDFGDDRFAVCRHLP